MALVISEYTDETNAFSIKLHRLIDAAETITRFLCIVTVSDVYAQLGRFPRELNNKVLAKLRQPTFGPWRDILSGALDALASTRSPSIPRRAASGTGLGTLIATNQADYREHILPLRNHMAHVGLSTCRSGVAGPP